MKSRTIRTYRSVNGDPLFFFLMHKCCLVNLLIEFQVGGYSFNALAEAFFPDPGEKIKSS